MKTVQGVEAVNGNLAYKLEPREEVIGGKVVLMAPATVNHNRIVKNITVLFENFLRGRTCEYFANGNGLYLSEDEEEYIPDGMVVCDPDKVRRTGIFGVPDLVIEVLSPGTARYDRGHKKDVYEKYGVREYWIVSPTDLSVEQYLLQDGHFVLRDVYTKYAPSVLAEMKEAERAAVVTEFPCGMFDGLTVRLDEVFGRIIIY